MPHSVCESPELVPSVRPENPVFFSFCYSPAPRTIPWIYVQFFFFRTVFQLPFSPPRPASASSDKHLPPGFMRYCPCSHTHIRFKSLTPGFQKTLLTEMFSPLRAPETWFLFFFFFFFFFFYDPFRPPSYRHIRSSVFYPTHSIENRARGFLLLPTTSHRPTSSPHHRPPFGALK